MKKLRVFISSPGDVQIERNVARTVINELNTLYSQHLKIEVLMWEDFPLSADATFQEGINYFLTGEHIDLAVFILWSRLGTPLSVKFRKEDGTPYNSGTEYEFDLMMKLHKESGHPSRILTYVKKDDSYPKDCKWDELREIIRQKEGLDAFLKEYFRDEETKSNYAYLPFGKNVSFEQVFRTHLTNAIKDYIGEIEGLKEWEGNPYVGLKSFEYDQASIFFGRRQLVYETASRLIAFDSDDPAIKSLIVLGESGSGKSSFVKAGLLPFLCNGEQSVYKHVIVTPSMYAGSFYNGLLGIIQDKFGFLSNHPFMEELRKGVTAETNFEYLSYELENRDAAPLIIYVDQFEELFSDSMITEEERTKVLLLLRGLVSMSRIAVFMSMRSDFYNRFSVYGEMYQIKAQCEVLDLPVMGAAEIAEIIEEPARRACLRWEIDSKGIGLNRQVLKDAVAIKGLPLIEFALSELYEARDDKDLLTEEAYRRMGGLKGAVANYADGCYEQLSKEEKEALYDLLGFVVTESASHKDTYVRRTSVRTDMEKSPLHKRMIDKMLDARLFVTGKDSEGRATVTVVHEILLKSWSVVAEWIEKEKEFISANRHYEQLAQHWMNGNKKKTDLIRGRTALLEAEYFRFKYPDRLSDIVLDYFCQSFIKVRSKLKQRLWIALTSYLTLSCLLGVCWKLFGWDLEVSYLDQFTVIDAFFWLGVSLILLCYSIYISKSRNPKVETLKITVAVWASVTLLLGVYSVIGQPDDSSLVLALLYPFAPAAIYLIVQLRELTIRRKWVHKYVGYILTDDVWERLKTTLVVVVVSGIVWLGTYNNVNKYQTLINDIDELMSGYENIRNQLTYSDNKYLDERRMEYLVDHFSSELTDGYADERDLQYAKALYNRVEPEMALEFLDKDSDREHHLLEIVCQYAAGHYDEAELSLEEYVRAGEWHKIDNYISTRNLIWYSEVLGRFDLVSCLDSVVLASEPTSKYEPSYMLNKGHFILYEGNIDQAVVTYNQAIDLAAMWGYVDESGQNTLRNILKNDLHIFSRFESLPDDLLRKIADMMGVEFVPAYVPKAMVKSSDTELLMGKLAGEWHFRHTDGLSLFLRVDPETKVFTYIYRNAEGEEVHKSAFECRLAIIDGEIYWDEFCPMEDYNSFSKLVELEDDYFVLEVIENGTPDEKGTKRRYERVK